MTAPRASTGDVTTLDTVVGTPPVSDRRTRRRERSREEIYAAAVELFIDQGFDDTTMEQISQRADVARATVFNHFSRKTAFLDEWTTRRRNRAAQAVRDEGISGLSLDQLLRRYMIEMARLSEETRPETVALMKATSRGINLLSYPALADELAAFIEEAQRSGEARREMSTHQAGVLTATAYFAVLTEWISAEPPPFDLQTELLRMLDNILYGIFIPPGDQNERSRRAKGPARATRRKAH